jgi:hypothetical protein
MEQITMEKDVRVFYITAASFPDCVKDAFQKLHASVPFSRDWKLYGISRPEHGVIVYRAAVEEKLPGEGEKYHCDSLVLKKGNYNCVTLHDYMKDLSGIGKAFQELLLQPGLDPNGYCVEWYVSDKEVKCMIRMEG